VVAVREQRTSTLELAPGELGESLSRIRLCSPKAQQEMQRSLSRLGQLTPVQAYRGEQGLEVFDGLKRLWAARELSWEKLRVEVHGLDAAGAKVRLLCCNTSTNLDEIEEAWLVRSLYRDDGLSQPQIAVLLRRHKSWVCRRLAMAESLCDGLSASVRLGLIGVTAAAEVARLQRCNQDVVAEVITKRGLTTRQASRLVQALLAIDRDQWPKLLEQVSAPAALTDPRKRGVSRRSPAERMVADAFAIKELAVRLQTRLLERSLGSLGAPACAVVSRELTELHSALKMLSTTLQRRLNAQEEVDVTA